MHSRCYPVTGHERTDAAVRLIALRRATTNPEASSLSTEGTKQIDTILESVGTEEPEAIVSSEMPRALVTAKELANRSDLPLIRQDGFQERSFGDWDTWDWPSIAAKLDPLSLEERFTFVPPNGESWQQMEQRLREAVGEVAALPYSTVIVVTHWGPIRALLPMLNSQPRESTLQLEVANGQSFVFDLGR